MIGVLLFPFWIFCSVFFFCFYDKIRTFRFKFRKRFWNTFGCFDFRHQTLGNEHIDVVWAAHRVLRWGRWERECGVHTIHCLSYCKYVYDFYTYICDIDTMDSLIFFFKWFSFSCSEISWTQDIYYKFFCLPLCVCSLLFNFILQNAKQKTWNKRKILGQRKNKKIKPVFNPKR